MFRETEELSEIRWLRCTNASSSATIPAFGVVAATDAPSGVLLVDAPTKNSQFVYVNGPVAIPPKGAGACTEDAPVFALYHAADGTPAVDDSWGAGTGSYELRKGKAGFAIVGGATQGRVYVRRSSSGVDGGGDVGTRWTLASAVTLSANSTTQLTGWTTSAVGFVPAGYDTDNMTSVADKLTIKTAGKYLVGVQLQLGSTGVPNTTSVHADVYLELNAPPGGGGSYVIASASEWWYEGANSQQVSIIGEYDLAINDNLTVYAVNFDTVRSMTAVGQWFARRVA